FVFSWWYGAPRELHPFPTRRSSDLSARAGTRDGVDRTQNSPVIRDERGTGPRAATKSVRRSCIGGQRGDTRGRRARFRDTAARIDRKSTRLNSSHVKISYAVFCLKK